MTTTDLYLRSQPIGKAPSDIVMFASASGGGSHNYSVATSDDISGSLADSVARVFAAPRALNDTTSLSDANSRKTVVGRATGEVVSSNDVAARMAVYGRVTPEMLSYTESTFRLYAAGRQTADSIVIGDNYSARLTWARSIVDAIAVADVVSRSVVVVRFVSDAVTGSDQLYTPGKGTLVSSDISTFLYGNYNNGLVAAAVASVFAGEVTSTNSRLNINVVTLESGIVATFRANVVDS